MLSVKTSQIFEKLTTGREHIAADTTANRVWTDKFAAKANVPRELVAAAFFGHQLNQQVDGTPVHSNVMLGRLSEYLSAKRKNDDLPPESRRKLLVVSKHVTSAVVARAHASFADLKVAVDTARRRLPVQNTTPRAPTPRSTSLASRSQASSSSGSHRARSPRRVSSSAVPPAVHSADAAEQTALTQRSTAILTFNHGVIAAKKTWEEAKGAIETMGMSSGPEQDRYRRQAQAHLRQVRNALTGLIADAPQGAKVDVARGLRKLACDKLAEL